MKKICFFILLSMGFLTTALAQTTNYQVHSLFILNIAIYSTWPSASNEFHTVVVRKSKLYEEIVKQEAGKNINGLAIKVTQAENITDIGSAQIVLLADGKSGNLNEILKATEAKPILIIA